MKVSIISAYLLVAAAGPVAADQYDGYKVFRVPVGDKEAELKDIVQEAAVDTWQGIHTSNTYADVVVPPQKLAKWQAAAKDLSYRIMHEDLGVSVKRETTYASYNGVPNANWFKSYHSFDDHVHWLYDLENHFPKNAQVVSSGLSTEGRNITGIHIFKGKQGKKPAVILHAQSHAREWISGMTVEYIAYQLLTGAKSDKKIQGYLNKFEFYIFPFVNPDGFVYSQKKDRFWRKNRQKNPGSKCVGRDLNRNWPLGWGTEGGASTNPCEENYQGLAAGDAPETKALLTFVNKIKAKQGLKAYWDFHSYSQLFMTPYGYTCDRLPKNNAEYQSLAKGATRAITKVHGTPFDYGPICQTIYPASGGSIDYVADVTKADYVFAIELRDRGDYGFVLPPKQIIPTGEETFAGLAYILTHVK